jgi:4-deoxy-L-threo-5-hexosulose-uronate ketol-isomerase
MEVRYAPDAKAIRTMTNEELRKHFLISSLFVEDAVPMVYSDIDRSITGSAVPVHQRLTLVGSKKEMAAEFFLERREIGIINIGGDGILTVDGVPFTMNHKDGLYIGRGVREVQFASASSADPAKFYFVSFPAHAPYPTAYVKFAEAESLRLGSEREANKRTIHKYIHPRGVKSCQLVMGLTELETGSVWNTMPVHTHQRRSETYMYFNLKQDAIVVHLMGEPGETKHIIVRNGQAVLSPSWSIHSGVATSNYSFIWAMGGENQDFDDMDWVPMNELC